MFAKSNEHRVTELFMTFPAEDVGALSAVISELASNQLRNKLGQGSRQYVLNQRTWPKIVHNYQEIYQRYS